jgi:uncharacterized membrane protein YciS (DUF1049 family)
MVLARAEEASGEVVVIIGFLHIHSRLNICRAVKEVNRVNTDLYADRAQRV